MVVHRPLVHGGGKRDKSADGSLSDLNETKLSCCALEENEGLYEEQPGLKYSGI